MAKKKDENPRSKNFFIELYPDNAEHSKAFEKLFKGYNAAGILHNRDVYTKERVDENGEVVNAVGEIKKEHWHIILNFANSRYLNGVSKEIGVESRFIQKADSFRACARYLIHLDDEDKAQYTLDEVFGSADMLAKVKKACADDKTATSVIFELLNQLDSIDRVVSSGEFARIALNMGYIDVYNRFKGIMADWIAEHNSSYLSVSNSSLKLRSREFEIVESM